MASNGIRLTVAHNGDPLLIPQLAAAKSVQSVFGKMSMDLVGGGRSAFALAQVKEDDIGRLVAQAHAQGLKYIYLLNAPCLANAETTRAFNDRLFSHIGKLVDLGVDGFVVSLPYLLDLIKHNFPKVTVSVSTFALVNSVTKARIWEDKGADRIILVPEVNRDFRLLKKIRGAVSCELELFANCQCLHQCPFLPFHAAFSGHSSATMDRQGGFGLDYCGYSCSRRRLEDPTEFVRGRFIRPEDLHLYEDVGIDVFKVADRIKPTHWLLRAAKAYDERHFDGNLADIINFTHLRGDQDAALADASTWFLRLEHVSLGVLKEMAEVGQAKTIVRIDNKKLDGFCEHFTRHDCRLAVCGEDCTHCEQYAKRAITVDVVAAEERLRHTRRILEMLADRSAFTPEPLAKRAVVKMYGFASKTFGIPMRKGSKPNPAPSTSASNRQSRPVDEPPELRPAPRE